MNTLINESIDFYAKLLKVPTFRNYEEIVRQLDKKAGYGDFLLEVMKNEYDVRQAAARNRTVKAAKFPYLKTYDELLNITLRQSRLSGVARATFPDKQSHLVINYCIMF